MIIGIDASKAAEGKRTGIENFVYQLIFHLGKIDQENQYLLFTNRSLPKELIFKNFRDIYIPFPKFWNKLRLPMALLKHKPEIYIQPTYMIPAFAPKKTIGIIHDLAWVKFPGAYSKKELLLQKISLENIVKNAAKIVCVSKSAQDDLIDLIPKSKDRTFVINLGRNEAIGPIDNPKDILKIGSKYFLSIGRLEERKNTKSIIEAFSQFKKAKPDYKLVLVGKPGYGFDAIKETISKLDLTKDVIITGYLPDNQLNDLLSGAEALVYPSLYEGFGMPALEAMQAGTPVITSNISSLPAVVGDTGILVNPLKTEEIAAAMEKVANDKKLRDSLISRGFDQAKKFSWDKTAKEYLKLMEEM